MALVMEMVRGMALVMETVPVKEMVRGMGLD